MILNKLIQTLMNWEFSSWHVLNSFRWAHRQLFLGALYKRTV